MTASRERWLRACAGSMLILLIGGCSGGGIAIAPNEFRTAGGGLACITQDPAEYTPPYLNCLRIGPVRIGQTRAEISRLFGKPSRVLKRRGGVIRVYPIKATPKPAYWVIVFSRGDRVRAIQLTGVAEDRDYPFSSIRLGDRSERVREILGKPAKVSDAEEIGGTLWSYRPFPISFEMKGGRVYSMKVWNNAPRRRRKRRS